MKDTGFHFDFTQLIWCTTDWNFSIQGIKPPSPVPTSLVKWPFYMITKSGLLAATLVHNQKVLCATTVCKQGLFLHSASCNVHMLRAMHEPEPDHRSALNLKDKDLCCQLITAHFSQWIQLISISRDIHYDLLSVVLGNQSYSFSQRFQGNQGFELDFFSGTEILKLVSIWFHQITVLK